MGLDLFEHSGTAKDYFHKADEIMNVNLSGIMFNGPEDLLKQTQYTQPALYVHSVIIAKLLAEKEILPYCAAGHSLGEFSAYTIAGVFDFETGLELVKTRALSMQKAGETNPGTMAAIIGLNDDQVIEITHKTNGIVVAANFNSPGQVVISGETSAVNSAMELAKESGARMVMPLNVSGAFHSPLMSVAREELVKKIDSIEINNAMIPVYANVNAQPLMKADEIRSAMVRQLENPVLWSQTITNMARDGVEKFIEVGSGRVLQSLCKRIDINLLTEGVDGWEYFNA